MTGPQKWTGAYWEGKRSWSGADFHPSPYVFIKKNWKKFTWWRRFSPRHLVPSSPCQCRRHYQTSRALIALKVITAWLVGIYLPYFCGPLIRWSILRPAFCCAHFYVFRLCLAPCLVGRETTEGRFKEKWNGNFCSFFLLNCSSI